MTDKSSWQPPVAAAASAAPTTPWEAAPAAATSRSGASGADTVWKPPPRPGLIPLQPLAFGTILGSSFRVIRRNPGATLGLSLLTYGTTTLIGLLIYGYFYLQAIGPLLTSTDPTGADTSAAFGSLAMISLAIVPFALSLVASGIMQGIVSLEVARGTVGERLKARGLWKLARGRIAPLVGWSLLLFAALLIGGFATVFALVLSIAAASLSNNVGAAAGIAIGLGFALFAGFIVLVAWLGTKTVLVPSLLILGRLSLTPAIRRSWSLTGGFFWRTFGTLLLINVIISFAGQIISTPIALIGTIVTSLLYPNGASTTSAVDALVPIFIASAIVSVVMGAIGLVAQSSATALIYIDIRMRKEGLDLELMQYVENKNSATPGATNPFERVPQPTQATSAPGSSPWA